MPEKIDIEASKNEDLNKLRSGLYLLLITAMMSFSMQSWAQTDTLETACDTTVLGHHYTLRHSNSADGLITFGNRNKRGQKQGWWCVYYFPGCLVEVGKYRRNIRIGTWRGLSGHIVYDRKGSIISREHVWTEPCF